jgi:hypothetical protein
LAGLLDVKLWGKGLQVAVMAMITGSAELIEVVDETEERTEGGGGIIGHEGSWAERHFACYCGFEKSSFDLSDW